MLKTTTFPTLLFEEKNNPNFWIILFEEKNNPNFWIIQDSAYVLLIF
jgi:hypothetical protein